MGDPVLAEAEALLAQLPQLFPDERERVRAALASGNAETRAKIVGKLRAARDEYALRGQDFERKAGEAFGTASAKLAEVRQTAAKGTLARAENAARQAEDDPGDLLSGL